MSWNQNGQQQNGGYDGPRRAPKIPQAGFGRLRKTQKKSDKSPDFKGLACVVVPAGVPAGGTLVIDLSAWFEPSKVGPDGRMWPESFSLRAGPYDPNAQYGQQAPQGQQQPQYPPQQPLPYAPQQPQVYAQPAPGPAYAPSPQPPQHGGYAPAPGYQPPPAAAPAAQPPQWGGQPAQGRPPQAQAQAGYKQSDVPF